MNKSNIKNNKFRLAKETKISDDLINLLQSANILSVDDVLHINAARNAVTEAAFDIYKKLEKSENEEVFNQITELFRQENQTKVLEILHNEAEPEKKNKNKKTLPLSFLNKASKTTSTCNIKPTIEPYQITNSNIYYHFDQRLGTGNGEGKVFRGYKQIINAVNNTTRIPAAVKKVDIKDVRLLNREIEVWSRLAQEDSPETKFIVTLLDMIKEEDKVYFAMKLAERNLHEEITIHLNPFRDRRKIIGYMKNVSEALSWLHSQNILHRHIKPQNVLIYQYKNETVAKLGEFGISRPISKPEGSISAGRGTEEWNSPEALEAKFIGSRDFLNTKMMDIFSLGILFHFSLTGGEHPFSGTKDIATNIRLLSAPQKDLDCANLACQANLVRWMLQKEPTSRPEIKQVLKHPCFWDECKVLTFLKNVASCASVKKGTEWENIRKCLDKAYQSYYYSRHPKDFSWVKEIDSRLFERKADPTGRKKYVDNSLMSLVELIRDKDEHKKDMLDDLYKIFSTEEGGDSVFCEHKYAKYFLQQFPDIGIILFCSLASIAKEYKVSMDTLYTEYLKYYVESKQFWCDPTVKEFLNEFTIIS